jgi:hypothetical protein
LRYIQLAKSMIAGFVDAQACTLGSTKKPSVCSTWMTWRALSNATVAPCGSSMPPRTRR